MRKGGRDNMDWMSILNECLDIILPAIASVIAVLFGVLGAKLKSVYDTKIKTDTAKIVVDDVVKFVQQVYKDLDGPEKLQKALTEASTILNEKGISISDTELDMLIESAVYGLKQGITETVIEKLPEETTKEEVKVKDGEITE